MTKEPLERIADALEAILAHIQGEGSVSISLGLGDEDDDSDEPGAPGWLTQENVSELGAELAVFIREQKPEANHYYLDHTLKELFWNEKGLAHTYRLPAAARVLIDRVELVATKEFARAREEQARQEKLLVPQFVEQCASWARSRGLKKLNQSDVRAIIDATHPELQPDTVRAVWQDTNLALKG